MFALARYPNLALKWCHAPSHLSNAAYPFRDVLPHLRRAIEAFGPERIMWASDHTQSKTHHSWAQALYYLLKFDSLADREKKWNAFQADPEWHQARAETEKNGPIVAKVVNSFLQPTSFSAVK